MNDATVRRRVVWEYAADTNVGMVRTVNEDAILARPEIGVWAVADGMGGHAVGDVASKMVLEAIEEIGSQDNLTDLVNCVEDNLIKVNQKILKYSETELNNKTVGSTIVVLIISGTSRCWFVGGRFTSISLS